MSTCTFCGTTDVTTTPVTTAELCDLCEATPAAHPGAVGTSPMDQMLRKIMQNVNAALHAALRSQNGD